MHPTTSQLFGVIYYTCAWTLVSCLRFLLRSARSLFHFRRIRLRVNSIVLLELSTLLRFPAPLLICLGLLTFSLLDPISYRRFSVSLKYGILHVSLGTGLGSLAALAVMAVYSWNNVCLAAHQFPRRPYSTESLL